MEIVKSYTADGIKCLLVDIKFKYNSELNADIHELEGLVRASEKEIGEIVCFSHNKPDVKYFCGLSKIENIKEKLFEDKELELVVFNSTLSPSQERDIEKVLECKVIDRTRLILEIFSLRAKTHEGKLQVELAKLSYQSTRLVRGWTHLERQKGGIGVRGGPGETQLEIDRRLIRQRIKQITTKLDKVKNHRLLSRNSRKKHNLPTVSFVGYTNAGKSTLFNKISGADVYVKDQLFATLDPTLRKVNVPKTGDIIFSDTVGFIKNLPHDLVEAFHATLEEVLESNLLIHVIDYSDENHHSYIKQVNDVLAQIKADDKPILYVYNKIDRLDIEPNISQDEDNLRVYLSAHTGEGIELMYQAIAEFFNTHWVYGNLTLPPQDAKLRAKLYNMGVVENEETDEEYNFMLRINIAEADFNKLVSEYKINTKQNLTNFNNNGV